MAAKEAIPDVTVISRESLKLSESEVDIIADDTTLIEVLTPQKTSEKYPIHHSTSISSKSLRKSSKLSQNGPELMAESRRLHRESQQLKQAIKILETFENEARVGELIDKWRDVCQKGMSYLYNSTLFKIDRMGGYEELKRRETEQLRRKLEYDMEDGAQDEVDRILESPEFLSLPQSEQRSVQREMESQLEERERMKQKKLQSLEDQITSAQNNEFTMEELALRLKVQYNLIFD